MILLLLSYDYFSEGEEGENTDVKTAISSIAHVNFKKVILCNDIAEEKREKSMLLCGEGNILKENSCGQKGDCGQKTINLNGFVVRYKYIYYILYFISGRTPFNGNKTKMKTIFVFILF